MEQNPEITTLQKAILVLETTTEEQGRVNLFDGELYCALGVVCRDVLGLTPQNKHYWAKDGVFVDPYVEARKVLPQNAVSLIWEENDLGATFKEIAGFLREKFL